MTLPASLPPYPPGATSVGMAFHADLNFIYKAVLADVTSPSQLPAYPPGMGPGSFFHSDLNFIYKAILANNTILGSSLNYRGTYDPSAHSGTYPPTGTGSGAGGAIKTGNTWLISGTGALNIGPATVKVVYAGYTIMALVDNATNSHADWNILNVGLGYLPVNKAGDTMTGNLKLALGTTSIAPVTFQAGANLSVAASGNMEFDGTQLFFSPSSARNILAQISGSSALTPGSVAFATTHGYLAQDNANLFWDSTNHKLGIGLTAPSAFLHVKGSSASNGLIMAENSGSANAAAIIINSTATTSPGNPNLGFQVAGVDKAGMGWSIGASFLGLVNMAYSATDFQLILDHLGALEFRDPAHGTASRFKITASGNGYISGQTFFGGTSSATALAHLAAGTATANTAPLKFTSGTNLSSAEAGAMEYDGTQLYFSPSSSRNIVAQVLGSTAITSGKMILAGSNGYLAGSASLSESSGNLVIADTVNMVLSAVTGTMIGTAVTQKLAFFNNTPVMQQTGGAATAGVVYTATEQAMLQAAYNCLRTFGFLS